MYPFQEQHIFSGKNQFEDSRLVKILPAMNKLLKEALKYYFGPVNSFPSQILASRIKES